MKADNDNFAGKKPKIFLNTVILLVHRVFTRSYLKIIFCPNPPKVDESRRWSLVLSPRHTYSMRVEDPVNRRGGLKLGSAFLSRWVLAGDLEPKSLF